MKNRLKDLGEHVGGDAYRVAVQATVVAETMRELASAKELIKELYALDDARGTLRIAMPLVHRVSAFLRSVDEQIDNARWAWPTAEFKGAQPVHGAAPQRCDA